MNLTIIQFYPSSLYFTPTPYRFTYINLISLYPHTGGIYKKST